MDANPVFIAEASSNHGRDLDRARAFVDAAADAGCDAVKFQLFKIDRMFAPEILAQSPRHRARAQWELPLSHLGPLAEHCSARDIRFSCTPFYREAVAELAPFVDFYKIASYELLHCVSAYPTPAAEANLSAIAQIRAATGLKTGWSDHTRRPAVIERAVHKWGAAAVEFHLDLDGQGAEYAGGHCWLPHEIAPVIARIRESAIADGSGFKAPQPSELSDREWRADPADGMRPLKHVRMTYKGEAA